MKYTPAILMTFLISGLAVAGNVRDAHYANPSDVAEAENFLSGVPAACSASYAYASVDGTVNIRAICKNSEKSISSLIKIKNGIITKIEDY